MAEQFDSILKEGNATASKSNDMTTHPKSPNKSEDQFDLWKWSFR
jgi:hypothetical protein